MIPLSVKICDKSIDRVPFGEKLECYGLYGFTKKCLSCNDMCSYTKQENSREAEINIGVRYHGSNTDRVIQEK